MSENQSTIEDTVKTEMWQDIKNESTADLMAVLVGLRRNIGLSKPHESIILAEGTIRRELEKRCEERGDIIAISQVLSNGTCIAAKIVDDVIFDRFIAEPNLAKKLAEDAK